MTRWHARLLEGIDDDGHVDLDNPAAIVSVEDLSLQELESIVYEVTTDARFRGLAALLFRLTRELRDLREQLESSRRAQELRR